MSQKGSALVMVPFMILFLLIAAFVVDYILVFAARRHLHTMTDAASLAGALSAEVEVEFRVNQSGEVERVYYANIVPAEAMREASEIIAQYSQGGIMGLIDISGINYTPIREGARYARYAVTVSGTHRTLLASVVTGENLDFNITNESEARVDLLMPP
jgi:Flp pilus assembly protein TadG